MLTWAVLWFSAKMKAQPEGLTIIMLFDVLIVYIIAGIFKGIRLHRMLMRRWNM